MTGVIVIMGVSGVGKTTIGRALAGRLEAVYAEGDSYHPAENVEKMRSGRPLTDDDRWPWLDRMRAEIDRWISDGQPVVLACSALKASYRDRLRPKAGSVRFVYLHGHRELIEERLADRKGHYMPASLLESQLAILEPPEDAICVDVDRSLDDILDEIMAQLTAKR